MRPYPQQAFVYPRIDFQQFWNSPHFHHTTFKRIWRSRSVHLLIWSDVLFFLISQRTNLRIVYVNRFDQMVNGRADCVWSREENGPNTGQRKGCANCGPKPKAWVTYGRPCWTTRCWLDLATEQNEVGAGRDTLGHLSVSWAKIKALPEPGVSVTDAGKNAWASYALRQSHQ